MKTAQEVSQMTHLYAHFCGRYVSCHCVKSVGIRSFSGPYFPAFGMNTERQIAFSVFCQNTGNTDQKTPNTDTFHAVCVVT